MATKIIWKEDLVFGTEAAKKKLSELVEQGIAAADIKLGFNGEGIIIMWPTTEEV